MKKEGKLQWRRLLLPGVFAVCLALVLGIFADGFSIVSHADSQGKITVNSAIIRSEPSTSSERIGSAKKDSTITIVSQVPGADGKTWYEVKVNSATKGYIRSDLVSIIDGSTPPAGNTATTAPETPTEVTEVNPVSATVTGATSVRIRSNASTAGKIVATVSKDHTLTVTGQANGTDGRLWYQVSFISNGSQITGFIREDYVTLSGAVTPVTPSSPDVPQPPEETPLPEVTPEPTQPSDDTQEKEFVTIWHDNEWKLYKPETDEAWSVSKLLEGNLGTVKTQKTIIIFLVIFLVAAVAAVGYLIFKLKDVMDSAYFNQVESETLRRRSAAAAQGSSQRVMHTVGNEKQPTKPAGTQGQKPTGAQGQKPAGTQGQRPAGAQSQRPAGTQSQRPAGTPQGQRPAGAPQSQRPVGAQGQRPASQGQPAQNSASKPMPKDGQQAQGWQSKNFMTDEDDEFEFEFLNVDSSEKNG